MIKLRVTLINAIALISLCGLSFVPHAGTPAADAPVSAADTGTRLVLLGTQGGPTIRKHRSQPANLIVVDGYPYLIDTGTGVSRQLKWAGFDVEDITNVFLTHLHLDHVIGLAPVVGLAWTRGKSEPFEVYGPPGTGNFVKGALAYLRDPVKIYAAQLPPRLSLTQFVNAHDIDISTSEEVFVDERVRVTAVGNSHYTTMNADALFEHRIESYAYRFDSKDRSIVFTGDTGPSDAIAKLAKGADILVSEVIDIEQTMKYLNSLYKNSSPEDLERTRAHIAHMREEHLTSEELGKLAQKAGVKMVVLSHLIMGSDEETDYLHYVNGVRQNFDGVVVTGRDLDQF
mgnify:CR=1 FL=1